MKEYLSSIYADVVHYEKKITKKSRHSYTISDLISDFGIASMLNYTINHRFGDKIYGMINMEAIPKFDSKSVIKFDISTKLTTWIGHKTLQRPWLNENNKNI